MLNYGGLLVDISLSSDDIMVFQRIYSEKSEAVEWMWKFGNPLEKEIAGLVKKAVEN
jgi:adenosine deaminase